MDKQELQNMGKDIERILKMRTFPVAVKMLRTEADIPEGALRPRRDKGYHLAQCQAFSLARRQGTTVAMLKEDHWCFAPLLAYGIIDDPDDEFVNAHTSFPRFKPGVYIGMVSAPLHKATFEPDVVLLYVTPAQLRSLLMIVKFTDQKTITSEFDPIDSCCYDIVPVVENDEFRVTVPDPGEHARAAASDDEMIFSIPGAKLPAVVEGLHRMEEMAEHDTFAHIEICPDFHRPDFYRRLFEKWGLETEPPEETP